MKSHVADESESSGEESESSGEESESSGEESSEEELDLDEEGRTAVGGHVNYATRCFDDAIRLKPNELSQLVKDCSAACTARAAGVGEELSAGSTFWVQADSTPTTQLERMALEIFKFHTRGAQFDGARSGAEWWCMHIDGDDEIGLHWDRDYDMQADQGLLLHPHVATVTYLSSSTSGNPTVVFDRPSPLFASESPCGSVSQAFACWPHVSRHLCFDGKRLHGAPSGLVPEGGSSTTTTSTSTTADRGYRTTLLVNCWMNHKPWGAEPLPASVASRLRARSSGGGAVQLAAATERPPTAITTGAAPPARPSGPGGNNNTARGAKAAGRPSAAATTVHRWKFRDCGRSLQLAMAFPDRTNGGGGGIDQPGESSPFLEVQQSGSASAMTAGGAGGAGTGGAGGAGELIEIAETKGTKAKKKKSEGKAKAKEAKGGGQGKGKEKAPPAAASTRKRPRE